MERKGYLLIADITGYTTYLSESELEHAEQTLSSLLELLVTATPPPLAVAQLEGDAVMSYAFGDEMPAGQTFIETIEAIYVEFRRALELMVLNTTCECNACANIPSLDLKFFVHHGVFVVQPILDREQLVGSDVNLIHRLLKNSVTGTTGIVAYLLVTDPARLALSIEEESDWLQPHLEDVPDFGEVTVWIRDMRPAYATSRGEVRDFYGPDDVLSTMTTEISAPPHVVWDHLRDSMARNLIFGSDRYEIDGASNGWVGEGSTYRCFHGGSVLSQLVVEWSPPVRLVFKELVPVPGRPIHTILDFTLESTDGRSTRLRLTATKPDGPPLQRSLAKAWMRRSGKRVRQGMADFGALVAGVRTGDKE